MNSAVLITRNEKNSIRIDHEKLRELLIRPEIGDKPIAIISIAGCTRSGKSFMLNFVLRYFRAKGWINRNWMGGDDASVQTGGLEWRSGHNRVTTGIRIWDEIFEVKRKDGTKMIVMLMDSQGLFDNETTDLVNKTLLTLTTLASSVLIFNAKEQINTQNLTYLKTCVDFAKASASRDNAYFKLQKLMFLVRDAEEGEGDLNDDPCFGLEHGQRYLDSILDSDAGGKENVIVRKGIKSSFSEVKCFMMPFPGAIVKKRMFKGRNDELDTDFLKFVGNFVEEIANPSQLEPKRSNKKDMTARELLNMITACDSIFSQQLFEADDLMKVNEKSYYSSEYEEAIREYDKRMKKYVDKREPTDPGDLGRYHKDCKKMALQRYNTATPMGSGLFQLEFRKHLEEQCENHFMVTKELNATKKEHLEKRRAEEVKRALRQYQSAMMAQLSGSLTRNDTKKHNAILEELHKKNFNAIREKYKKKVDLGKLVDKLQQTFEELRHEWQRRYEEEKELAKEERRKELFVITNDLKIICSKKWAKETISYRDEEDMKQFEKALSEKLENDYWEKALNPAEDKYLQLLKEKLKHEYENAHRQIQRSQNWQALLPPLAPLNPPRLRPNTNAESFQEVTQKILSTELQGTPEEEKDYHEQVIRIVGEFASSMQDAMNGGVESLRKMKGSLIEIHEMKLVDSFSEYLFHYHKILMDFIMAEAKKAAQSNQENWEALLNKMDEYIKETFWKLEIELQESMTDRYLDQEDLKEYFQNFKKELKSQPHDEFKRDVSYSTRAKEAYCHKVDEFANATSVKVMKMNASNEDKRNVRNVPVPNRKSIFGRVIEWIKLALLPSEPSGYEVEDPMD